MIYIAFHFLYDNMWLCGHICDSSRRAYIYPLYEKEDNLSTPFLDITSSTTRVSSIFIFGTILDHFKTIKINVKIDSYKWLIIMTFDFTYVKKDNSSDSVGAAVFIIVNTIIWNVITRKERRSDLIVEISDSIKKKYININFDFILK